MLWPAVARGKLAIGQWMVAQGIAGYEQYASFWPPVCSKTKRGKGPVTSAAVLSNSAPPEVVFAIPARNRPGDPDCLTRTIASMQALGGIRVKDQVYVMDCKSALEMDRGGSTPHPTLDTAQRQYEFRRIDQDTRPVDIHYTPSPARRVYDNEVERAFNDSDHQKRWRIQEAQDWRHIMATLLHTTSNARVPYIGINQDYAEWEGTPLVFDAPITSLWSEAGEGCEVCQQRDIPVGRLQANSCNCGMVAMVFQRETLQSFLDWLEIKGRWKEKPVDWSLADFAQECGHQIVIKQTIKPVGSTSASMYALKEATRASNSGGGAVPLSLHGECFVEIDKCRTTQDPLPWAISTFVSLPYWTHLSQEQVAAGSFEDTVDLGLLSNLSVSIEYDNDSIYGPTPVRESIQRWTTLPSPGIEISRIGIHGNMVHLPGTEFGLQERMLGMCNKLRTRIISRTGGMAVLFATHGGTLHLNIGPRSLKSDMPVATLAPITPGGRTQQQKYERLPARSFGSLVSNNTLRVEPFWQRASTFNASDNKTITLCTQMDSFGIDNLPRLVGEWRPAPVSIALYLLPDSAERVKTSLSQPEYEQVRKWADIHLVEADLDRALFPINFLRNVAIDHSRTNMVFVVEGDMIVPSAVQRRLVTFCKQRFPVSTAFVVPLFEPKSKNGILDNTIIIPMHMPKDKASLLAASDAWTPCQFESHAYLGQLQTPWAEARLPQPMLARENQDPQGASVRVFSVRVYVVQHNMNTMRLLMFYVYLTSILSLSIYLPLYLSISLSIYLSPPRFIQTRAVLYY